MEGEDGEEEDSVPALICFVGFMAALRGVFGVEKKVVWLIFIICIYHFEL